MCCRRKRWFSLVPVFLKERFQSRDRSQVSSRQQSLSAKQVHSLWSGLTGWWVATQHLWDPWPRSCRLGYPPPPLPWFSPHSACLLHPDVFAPAQVSVLAPGFSGSITGCWWHHRVTCGGLLVPPPSAQVHLPAHSVNAMCPVFYLETLHLSSTFFFFLISHKSCTYFFVTMNKGNHEYNTNESQVDMTMLLCQHSI